MIAIIDDNIRDTDAAAPREEEAAWQASAVHQRAASRPHGVVISFADITARKRLEEALRADEARYRALVDHSADAVLLTAPGGQILAANPACVGYQPHPRRNQQHL